MTAEPACAERPGRLSPRYSLALVLEARGCGPVEMATALEVPVESLASLLRLAHAKHDAAEGC